MICSDEVFLYLDSEIFMPVFSLHFGSLSDLVFRWNFSFKTGLRRGAQPHFSCQCLLLGRPCERRFPQSRVTHFEQARLWRLLWFLTSAGWSQLPRTLIRGCPVNLPHSPHHAIALHSHWLPPRTVLLSFDLPTHDPFQMDQIPVDLWLTFVLD